MLCGRRMNRLWLQLNLLRTMYAYMVCYEQNLQSDNAGHTGCQCKANRTNDTSFFMGFREFLWCFLCCLCMHTKFSSIEQITTELLLLFHISCAFFRCLRFSLLPSLFVSFHSLTDCWSVWICIFVITRMRELPTRIPAHSQTHTNKYELRTEWNGKVEPKASSNKLTMNHTWHAVSFRQKDTKTTITISTIKMHSSQSEITQ